MSIMHSSSVVVAATRQFGDIITLSGTHTAAIARNDFAISPSDASVLWRLSNTSGNLEYSIGGGGYTQIGSEWCEGGAPTQDWWVRFTSDPYLSLDEAPNHPSSSTLNTWLKVGGTSSSIRYFGWQETTNGFAMTRGQVKVEIASDSGGSTIVATGYYRSQCDVEI